MLRWRKVFGLIWARWIQFLLHFLSLCFFSRRLSHSKRWCNLFSIQRIVLQTSIVSSWIKNISHFSTFFFRRRFYRKKCFFLLLSPLTLLTRTSWWIITPKALLKFHNFFSLNWNFSWVDRLRGLLSKTFLIFLYKLRELRNDVSSLKVRLLVI